MQAETAEERRWSRADGQPKEKDARTLWVSKSQPYGNTQIMTDWVSLRWKC